MNTYEKIITAAFQMFSEYGYDGISLHAISRKANVSKGAIYHYFSSKEELYLKVIEYYFEQINSHIKKTFKDVRSIKEFGKRIIYEYKTNNNITKFSLDIFLQSLKKQTVRKKVQKMYKIGMNLIRVSLENLEDINHELDLEILAQKIWILIDALCIYISYGINISVDKLWEEFIDDILQIKA